MSLVAVPTLGNKGLDDGLCDELNMAPTFTIADLESGHLTVIDNNCEDMGGTLSLPELLKGIAVDTVIVSHIETETAQGFKRLGITVLCGAKGSVREVLAQLKAGSLQPPLVETIH